MKVFAACYSDYYPEYSPSIFSLHLTKEGAEMAIGENKEQSYEQWIEGEIYYTSEGKWNPDTGDGYECWCIREMEIFP